MKPRILLVAMLMLSGCGPTKTEYTISNTVYIHNETTREISLSKQAQKDIVRLIDDLTFAAINRDSNFFRGDYHFTVWLDITNKNNETICYAFDVDTNILLASNPLLSSTISDRVANLNPAQAKLLKDAFGVIYEDATNNINCATYEVTYDYGLHIEGELIELLGLGFFFFNNRNYDITQVLAGDIFHVYYTGELLTQETYPSVVITDNLTVLDVIRVPARIIPGSLLGVPGSSSFDFVGNNYANNLYPDYVVKADQSYVAVQDYYDGTPLYASVRFDDKMTRPAIKALYAYNPYAL